MEGMMSHPAWVCGLKLSYNYKDYLKITSHPAWVCGLKHFRSKPFQNSNRHTLRGCVD